MFEADTNRINVVRNAAGKWADDLIDLGRTNTLLYFKDTKTSTLDLTQADPLALTRLLAGQKTHLNALIKDPSIHQAACTRARNIRKKIVAFEEEQGINVGHLARGLVRVTPPGSVSTTSPGRFRAPLLLQAVTVHTRTSSESDFTLEVADEPTINPVLLYALAKECGADLDSREFGEKMTALLAEISDPADQVQEAYQQLEDVLAGSGLSAELRSRRPEHGGVVEAGGGGDHCRRLHVLHLQRHRGVAGGEVAGRGNLRRRLGCGAVRHPEQAQQATNAQSGMSETSTLADQYDTAVQIQAANSNLVSVPASAVNYTISDGAGDQLGSDSAPLNVVSIAPGVTLTNSTAETLGADSSGKSWNAGTTCETTGYQP